MLFDLIVRRDGQEETIIFDNERNRFTLADGSDPLAAYHEASYELLDTRYSPDLQQLSILFINLGLSCNFSCRYCHQNSFRKNSPVTPCTPEKATSLLNKLKDSTIHPRVIALWGGEPLVYIKALKVLIPGLRKIYPEAKINFPTNGKLLNSQIIAFLKEYNVGFSVSYDGSIGNRDSDILSDPIVHKALQSSGRHISFMPTLNRESRHPTDLVAELKASGIPLQDIAFFSIARCNPYNASEAAAIRIPDEKLQEFQDFIYNILHSSPHGEDAHLYSGVEERFNEILCYYGKGLNIRAKRLGYCGHLKGTEITIDADGKILSCTANARHLLQATLPGFTNHR